MITTTRSQNSSEELLVTQAMQGDLDAFNQLVQAYQNMVYNHAYSILNDPAAAEDASQDSFLKAFQGLNSFRGGSFRGWLLRITTNSAYDVLRRAKRRPTQPLFPEDEDGEELESAPWLADPDTSVQETVEQNELSEEIGILVEGLPEAYRNVLMLVDVYQFDYSEAAASLRIPIGTVKSRVARARHQMSKKIRETKKYAVLPI